jgi:hypothetical protein
MEQSSILILPASCQHILYDIYHCCVYSGKLLMMDRGTVRNMQFYSKNEEFKKLVHLFGSIIRNIFVIFGIYQQTCMTYTTAVYTVKNS